MSRFQSEITRLAADSQSLLTNIRLKRQVLDQLASIDLIELCNEAKIEHCRATRDLSSCARSVEHVLNSCGHASLCAECSQRCDVCPICRTSIPNNGNRVELRLYYKCIEAGLIPKEHDDRFQEKEDSEEDIKRLYSLFDVALNNNLVSLICHYVTDVCMDESAVSSDPVLAFLLDEVVVINWCNQSFKEVICRLQEIYNFGIEKIKSQLCLLQKFVVQLTGISNVLEVMVSSFKESFSDQLHKIQRLMENTLKAKQHLEVIVWCARHQFLEKVQPRYANHVLWTSYVCERKSAAVTRAWPDASGSQTDSDGSHGSMLFIEEALCNLGIDQVYSAEEGEVDITCLQDIHSPLSFRSKIEETNMDEGQVGYPFENLRAATDILFLRGTSDTIVAKHAIFLYYLFDRHWTRPEQEWRHIVDDFTAMFSISRQSLLESLAFYLLDDGTDQSVQEASRLLPEIAGPQTHPKIVQVLLEHQRPDASLTVLRCIGRDAFSIYQRSDYDGSQFLTCREAVTAVRVRIESGLLAEAFMYQRMHCSKVKEKETQNGSPIALSTNYKNENWLDQVKILVSDICHLCIRRNLVDRMIELPWNSDEEKILHECLLSHACENPASIHGSLLVVFYLQRYRYVEAYHVDRKLQRLEQKFLETATEDVVFRVQSIINWRTGLVDKSVELLPEVQRQQVTSGITVGTDQSFPQDVQMLPNSDSSNFLQISATEVTPSRTKPSPQHQRGSNLFPSRRLFADSPTNFTSTPVNSHPESATKASSVVQSKLLAVLGTPATRTSSSIDRIPSLNTYNGVNSPARDARLFSAHHRFQSPSSFQKDRHEGSITRITPDKYLDLMDTSHGNGISKESTNTLYPKIADEDLLSRPWSIGKEDMRATTRWRTD